VTLPPHQNIAQTMFLLGVGYPTACDTGNDEEEAKRLRLFS